MKTTYTIEVRGVRAEWTRKVSPSQDKEHLTYSSRAAAERALHFCPTGRRYRISALGLPVTVH